MLNNKKMKTMLLTGTFAAGLLSVGLASAATYTVQAGDTLSTIASRHQLSLGYLASQNAISDVNVISVGQVLKISNEETAQTTPSTVTTSTGLSAADLEAKEWIAQKESSGSYTAQNGQYYGRYQLTNTYLNGDFSPENQERVADQYVASRYGSWSQAKAFWLANGWY